MLAQSRPSLLRNLLCWLLLIAAWPGPLPVVHSHSQLLASKVSSASLASHFDRHHSCEIPDPTAWHIHWLLTPETNDGIGLKGWVDPHWQFTSADLQVEMAFLDLVCCDPWFLRQEVSVAWQVPNASEESTFPRDLSQSQLCVFRC